MSKKRTEFMQEIKSQNKRTFASKTKTANVNSKTDFKLTSMTGLQVSAMQEDAMERDAFLTTAKRNAAIIFSKYL